MQKDCRRRYTDGHLSILLSMLGDCNYDGIKSAVQENVVEERMVEEISEEKPEDERGL